MSTRSPLNQRYTGDPIEGKSKKSATSAKPKMKAAATVHKASDEDPKAKRARQRAEKREHQRDYQARLETAGPITDPRYKKFRKVWIILIVAALAYTAVSIIFRKNSMVSMICLVAAYVLIIIAVVVDFKFIRPFRKAQEEEAARPMSKNERKRVQKELEAKSAKQAAEAEARRIEKDTKLANSKIPILSGRAKKNLNAAKAQEVSELIENEEGASGKADADKESTTATPKKKSKKSAFTPKGTKAGNAAEAEEEKAAAEEG